MASSAASLPTSGFAPAPRPSVSSGAELNAPVSIRYRKRLRVGVRGNEFDAVETARDHVIDRVAACPTNSDDRNARLQIVDVQHFELARHSSPSAVPAVHSTSGADTAQRFPSAGCGARQGVNSQKSPLGRLETLAQPLLHTTQVRFGTLELAADALCALELHQPVPIQQPSTSRDRSIPRPFPATNLGGPTRTGLLKTSAARF